KVSPGGQRQFCAWIFSFVHLNYGVIRINGGESFQEIEFFPLEMDYGDYVLTFVTVFALSLLAGIYPSLRAAQTGIVGALRK
ncbi:MAG: hypothetical protein AAF570_21310, partial [Bacteroidota bacterium]